jgi:hypothetical protein
LETTQEILRCAQRLEALSPGLLAEAIRIETGEDYRERDLLDQVARLVEIFGVIGAADIVGCATVATGSTQPGTAPCSPPKSPSA